MVYKLYFTQAWSKLQLPIFTTLREDKPHYSRLMRENFVEVFKGSWKHQGVALPLGKARLISITRRVRVEDLDDAFTQADADLGIYDFLELLNRFYGDESKTKNYCILVFLWTEKYAENFYQLFGDALNNAYFDSDKLKTDLERFENLFPNEFGRFPEIVKLTESFKKI